MRTSVPEAAFVSICVFSIVAGVLGGFQHIWASRLKDARVAELEAAVAELTAPPANGGFLGDLEMSLRSTHARQPIREH